MKNIKINFVNRLVLQALVAMVLTEWFWSNSYIFDELAPYAIAAGFGLQVGLELSKVIKNFFKGIKIVKEK